MLVCILCCYRHCLSKTKYYIGPGWVTLNHIWRYKSSNKPCILPKRKALLINHAITYTNIIIVLAFDERGTTYLTEYRNVRAGSISQ